MKVVAFNGSPRRGGNTEQLIKTVFESLEVAGVETELVQVGGQRLSGCIACFKCMERKDGKCAINDDILNSCIDKMKEADGIIIGSPTYFADLTSDAKSLIDRAGFVGLVNGGLYRRKVGAAVVAVRRGGATHVFDSINHLFLISQMVVPGASYWNMGVGRMPGEVKSDEEGLRTMHVLGENMAWLIKLIKGEKPS